MELKATENRIIVTIDLQKKNTHTFSNGLTIRRERQYNNLNRRETEPVNAIVVDGEGLTAGTEVLVHPNSATENNQIYNYQQLSGQEISSDIRYFSIPKEWCFLYREDNEWVALSPYETALRVYESYSGIIEGIEPKLIKNVLYVTSGALKGKIVQTINASAYEVVFQDTNGQEGRIIRFRPFGDGDREEEAIAIRDDLTGKLYLGELLIGLEPSKAIKLELQPCSSPRNMTPLIQD